MLRYSLRPIVILKFADEISRNYATKVAFKVKNKAVKDHANDGTSKHTHIGEQQCVLADCKSKVCSTLCGQPTILETKGHNTHSAPPGRICRFISDHDAKGKNHQQYYVKANKKIIMTEQQKKSYGKSFKLDPAQQIFLGQHKDKYE